MASRRAKLAEDKNLKLLREIANLPANKQCFDCLQRGPTYINATIGSFVCTTCSGILRGLTPPHRVKSISMTTFTPEEIDFLRARGNEYCKYVWLGTFDTTTHSIESEVSDDQKKRDFMIQKYEKKRWYVDSDMAVKKMQNDSTSRQKQGFPQSQTYGTRSNSIVETQPLSRLLGKSPTPLTVQNNQSAEIWPHPVSSASAPSICTKTTVQNHGSRSIDLLSEFAGAAPTATNQANNTSANGNFANFESAFTAVEKTAVAPVPNMPTSASMDAYPMLSQPGNQPNPVNNFTPPISKAPTTAATAFMQQSNADRYAALADLDSLFNQPVVTKSQSWAVDPSISNSLQDPMSSDVNQSTYSTAPSNPFTSTADLWGHNQLLKSSFQSANPFQTGISEGFSYSQSTSSQGFATFQIPMVGNSPSENTRSQFNATFSAFPNQVVSPTNGYGPTNQLGMPNGGLVSPPSGSVGPWNVSTNVPAWSSSQMGLGGLFSSDNKVPEVMQHTDWIQNPVNPFTASSNAKFPAAPKSNHSNPFL